MAVFKQKIWWLPWLLVFVVVASVMYWLGFYIAIHSDENLNDREKSLTQQVERKNTEVVNLQRENAECQVDSQIESNKNQTIKEHLYRLERQLADKKDEIAFYREYIGPKRKKRRVNVRDWQVFISNKVENSKLREFRLLLQQRDVADAHHNVNGTVSVLFEGENLVTGEAKKIYWDEVSDAINIRSFPISLVYFKVVRGDILLPDDFKPEKVKVTLTIGDKEPKVKVFSWKDKYKAR
jgi:hypothetical protein